MKKRTLAAMMLGMIVGLGGLRADEAAAPAAAKRTAEGVAADLQAVDAEQKALAKKESELIDGFRQQTPGSTNLLTAAGGDEKLAAKMKKIQELQDQLTALRAEVRTEMAASPVLQQRRAEMEKRRKQLMGIQESRKTLEIRKRALLFEQESLKGKSPGVDVK